MLKTLKKPMKVNLLILSTLLVLSLPVMAENNANQLLDEVRNGLQSMSADFEQYEIDANERQSEILKGKMWLNAPDQFKWEYFDPAPQLIIANGEKVWIYDEDLEQVTIKQQNSTQNPIYVLLNKNETDKNYQVKLEETAGDLQWFNMTPNVASDEIKQVWLGIDNNNIKILKLKNQLDNIVVFEFSNVIRNPELPDDFFTFIPPEGIDIIRDSMGL